VHLCPRAKGDNISVSSHKKASSCGSVAKMFWMSLFIGDWHGGYEKTDAFKFADFVVGRFLNEPLPNLGVLYTSSLYQNSKVTFCRKQGVIMT
jgi:hypothetical protein